MNPPVVVHRTYDTFCQEYKINCILFNVQFPMWLNNGELDVEINGNIKRFPHNVWAANIGEHILSIVIYTKYRSDADKICEDIMEFVKLLSE